MKGLQPSNPTGALALVWFCCFVLALAVPLVLLLKASIENQAVLPAIEQISSLYAPHLGAVLAFYFATKPKTARRTKANAAPFIAAILVSFVWNAMIAGALLLVLFGTLTIDDALTFVTGAGPKLSWLVAPALGYFFAKPGDHT